MNLMRVNQAMKRLQFSHNWKRYVPRPLGTGFIDTWDKASAYLDELGNDRFLDTIKTTDFPRWCRAWSITS